MKGARTRSHSALNVLFRYDLRMAVHTVTLSEFTRSDAFAASDSRTPDALLRRREF